MGLELVYNRVFHVIASLCLLLACNSVSQSEICTTNLTTFIC